MSQAREGTDERAYEPLREIMRRHGATTSPKEFYWKVNLAFHAAEAEGYDALHQGMFTGSGPMWERLVGHLGVGPAKRKVLDVGAGTGLVGATLDRLCPERIDRITLLDPSEAMLGRCGDRSRGWRFAAECVRGDLQAVAGRRFDAITVSSVLHHIVELPEFCRAAVALLEPGGLLLTMQDPRASAAADPTLRERSERALAARRLRPSLRRALRAVARGTLGALGYRRAPPLAQATNRPLLEQGIIRRPLDLQSVWAVTDFHVPGQPGGFGKGIDVESMKGWLAPLVLVDSFTYEFQGLPWDKLTVDERELELELWKREDPHGALFGSVWRMAEGG
jgi:ubiquinone/menaquinone biosynthesis C-methylase UbiE